MPENNSQIKLIGGQWLHCVDSNGVETLTNLRHVEQIMPSRINASDTLLCMASDPNVLITLVGISLRDVLESWGANE